MPIAATIHRVRRWIRALYDWTISWADHHLGGHALFWIAFVESSFFPIPPDVLLIAMCFAARDKAMRFALICTAGSVLGGIFGWWIGHALSDSVAQPLLAFFDPSGETQLRIAEWYTEFGFYGILIAAITPIPYKVFTIFSGMMEYSLPLLIVASVLGRGLRFFVVAAIIRAFGNTVRPFIEKHLEWCFVAATVLLIGGFLAIKWLA